MQKVAEEFITHAKAIREDAGNPIPDIHGRSIVGRSKNGLSKRLMTPPPTASTMRKWKNRWKKARIAEELEPVAVRVDNMGMRASEVCYGRPRRPHPNSVRSPCGVVSCASLAYPRTGSHVTLPPARSYRSRTSPNTVLATRGSRQHHRHGKYFQAVDERQPNLSPNALPNRQFHRC